MASAFVLLMLLLVLLGFYYLKYVPDRRNELNRNAFLELNQLKYAVQYRNQAYQDALRNSIQAPHFLKRTFEKNKQIKDGSNRWWQLLKTKSWAGKQTARYIASR